MENDIIHIIISEILDYNYKSFEYFLKDVNDKLKDIHRNFVLVINFNIDIKAIISLDLYVLISNFINEKIDNYKNIINCVCLIYDDIKLDLHFNLIVKLIGKNKFTIPLKSFKNELTASKFILSNRK